MGAYDSCIGDCAFCERAGVLVHWTAYGAEEADWVCGHCRKVSPNGRPS